MAEMALVAGPSNLARPCCLPASLPSSFGICIIRLPYAFTVQVSDDNNNDGMDRFVLSALPMRISTALLPHLLTASFGSRRKKMATAMARVVLMAL